MKKILYLPITLLLIGCTHKIEVPENSKIVTKYTVFDENISPKLNVCTNDTIRDFKDFEGWECMFKLGESIFEVEYKIVLSKDGHMTEFHNHTVTENIDYRKLGIKRDTLNPNKLNGNDIYIKFSNDRNKVIDGSDSLEIEKIYPAEKLVFVKETDKNRRRHIYEYKSESEIKTQKNIR
jgi:hypothetical protein